MSIISFIEHYKVIDKIIAHLKLVFIAGRPPRFFNILLIRYKYTDK